MDLNINYKLPTFQSRLKDFEATDERKNTIEDASDKATGGTSATDHGTDGNLLHQITTISCQVGGHRQDRRHTNAVGLVPGLSDTPIGGHGQREDGDTGRSRMDQPVTVHPTECQELRNRGRHGIRPRHRLLEAQQGQNLEQ